MALCINNVGEVPVHVAQVQSQIIEYEIIDIYTIEALD